MSEVRGARSTGARMRTVRAAVLAAVVGFGSLAATAVTGPAGAAPTPRVVATGYRLLGGDGGVFSFGLPFVGSAVSDPTVCPLTFPGRDVPEGTCWSMASTRDGAGYWILNAITGVVSTYGTAVSYGERANAGGSDLWPVSVAIVPTPTDHGYWILDVGLSGLGSVEHYGDAAFHGDQTTAALGGIVGAPVGLAATPDGGGYWIVDSDGGVFAFGDAGFHGSMGGRPLNSPVVGMAATPDGGGYWLVAADGGVFAFGDAPYLGSMAGSSLAQPMVGMAPSPDGGGYWLVAADGGVFAFGDAPFQGSLAGTALRRSIRAVSTVGAPA